MQDEPWLKNKKWHDNEIRSHSQQTLWILWGFGILWWLLLCLPFLAAADKIKSAETAILVIVLLAGIALVMAAIKKTIEWRYYGTTPLTLSPFPGSIGGDVGGAYPHQSSFTPRKSV